MPFRRLLAAALALYAAGATAQQFAFFRVEGPPSAPGQPGLQSNSSVFEPTLAANGRVLVFSVGSGNNLSGGVGGAQLLALDFAAGAISLVTTTATGAASASASVNNRAVVSADGRYVAFETTSPTYVGSALGVQVARIDRVTRVATPINVTTAGTLPASDTARVGGISADGRFVVFTSQAAGLVPGGGANSSGSVFVRDVVNGVTERIDVGPAGEPGSGGAFGERPSISADGRFVAFASSAGNLLGTPRSGSQRIYVRDRQSGTTVQASLGPGGSDLSGASNAAISADGGSVAFVSGSSGASATQLWARRLASPAAVAVPPAANMGICDGARISSNGIVIAQCRLTTANTPSQAYLWDLDLPATPPALISGSDPDNTVPGNARSGQGLTISADARVFAFDSDASDLIDGDSNGATDVFVYADPAIIDTLLADGFE